MALKVNGQKFDTMKEACARLDISRTTMLTYLKEGFFEEPPTKKQGRGKIVRYFPEEWYEANEPKLK